MKNKGDFTQKEAQFVFNYPRCSGNGTKAAIAAGYSKKTAKGTAFELLRRPHIAAALASYLEKKLTKLDVTVDRVLQERARLAFFDPRKLFDEKGNPIPPHELEEDTARAVAGFKFDSVALGRGKARKVVTTLSDYKLADKGASLTALEKYLGMYDDEAARPGVFNIYIHLEQNNGKSA